MATVTITSPDPGATVAGVVTIHVDAPGVQKINFYVDGVLKGRDTVSPFKFDWYTERYNDGNHVVKAVTGNGRNSAALTVQVKNAVIPPPPVESPDNTVIVGTSGSIVGKQGHKWSISVSGLVVVDGTPDTNTGGVVRLAYEAGKVWQENQNHLWWWKVLPTDGWLPGPGTPVNPIPGTFVVNISGSPISGQTLNAVIA